MLALLLSLPLAAASAQTSATDGATPSGLQRGNPAGSYSLSGFDSVNLYNGNLNAGLPLLGVGGRGGAQTTVTLSLNSKGWKVERYLDEWYAANVPDPDWWTGIEPGYGPGVLQGRHAGLLSRQCHTNTQPRIYYKVSRYTYTTLTFTAPDGTEYELRDQNTLGQPVETSGCPESKLGPERGSVFVSVDGSAATFVSDVTIYDVLEPDSGHVLTPSGYLMLRDGTRYRIDSGTVTWVRDRNGNRLGFGYDTSRRVTSITDPLGRQVTFEYDVADVAPYGRCDRIHFKGANGQQRVIRVSKTNLGNALRPNSNFALQTTEQLFPELDGGSVHYDPVVPSKVWLPHTDGTDNHSHYYRFFYNPYGELARLELPTGGAVEYDVMMLPLSTTHLNIYRRVSERRVYADGATLEGRTTYDPAQSAGGDPWPWTTTVTVDQLNPAGQLLARSKHHFHGSGLASLGQFLHSNNNSRYIYSAWNEGREFQTDVFAADGQTLLRRSESAFLQRAAVPWWAGWVAQFGLNAAREPAYDVRPFESMTTSADTGQVAKKTYTYDGYNNLTDLWEYDFGSGAPGALARYTHTDYVTGSAYTSHTGAHLRSLPAAQQTYGVVSGSLALAAKSETLYDQYPLTPYAAISGWADPGTAARGNATTVSRWLDMPDSWLSTHAKYDQAGSTVSATDALGNTSTVSYLDSFSDGVGRNTYAFPTGTTSAVPAPSPGPHAGRGSATPLTASTVYDYWTGLAASVTDANGKVTTFQYDDPLDRPRRIDRPDGGVTEYEYGDTAGSLHVKTITYRGANRTLPAESRQHFDGLGRAVRSFLYDGSLWLTTDTQYDALGRAWRASANPYLSGGSGSPINPSGHWVETTFDALSRPTHVKTTADGAQVTTSYSGNTVTVTDQAGKARRSVTDALGRLTRLVEAPGAGSCQADGAGCATDYIYDALGSLRKVTQGGQLRYFMYDSLGRLLRVRNPEQNVNAALALSDTFKAPEDQLPNAQWTLGYSYDANGNLYQRTDARGVKATYTYDNLDRLIRTLYSDGTPFTLMTYDLAANGRGRFYANYESSTEGTINYVTAYDAAGRPTSGSANFYVPGPGWLPGYNYSRTYDVAGNVTSQTYPSGHAVSYNYDAAGRLADSGLNAAFSGNLGDGVARTYAAGVSYDGAGRMRQERFGTTTPLYHKRHYNARGQLYDVRLSTVPVSTDQWDWNRGAVVLWYGNLTTPHGQSSSDNNGNVVRSHSSVPLDDQLSNYSYHEQHYSYDALNRLSSVTEQAGTPAGLGAAHAAQSYTYDRWGNRQIDAAGTWLGQPSNPPDPRINETQFAVDAATNRIGAPGQPSAMQYDAAGNLTHDSYTGVGARAYDAENRMTSAWGPGAGGGSYLTRYVYDAAGKRVRRKAESGEAWLVYGFDGELLAEYAAAGATAQPRKEYGYRAGELLVVAEAGSGYSADAASSFSASQNPTGPWAYGYRSSGGSFTLLSTPSTVFGAGTETWAASAQSCCPTVTKNTTGATHQYPNAPSVVQPVDTLNLHPGAAGERAAVRWTAPQAGSYTFAGHFQGIDTYGTTTDVRIEHNGAAIFSGQVSGYGAQATFSLTRTVSAGEAVEFSVGYGANLAYDSDSTGLAVNITHSGSQPEVRWLVSDHLGTPRFTADQTGSLVGIRRHDYFPFGEEVGANVGGRTTNQGYSQSDGVRQRFVGSERDGESGLDYMQARYYSSNMGRFTSVDPVALTVARLYDPQQINLYAYCRNNPLAFIDPTGEIIDFANNDARKKFEEYEKYLEKNKGKKGFASLIATVQQLKNSDVTYQIALGGSNTFSGGTEGELTSDGKVINVIVGNAGGPSGERFSLNSRFAHELEHARQFDSGEFAYAFDSTTGAKLPGSVAGDISSEVKAWQAQLIASSPTDFQVMGGSRNPEFQFRVLDEFGKAKTDDERAGVLARISDTYKSSYERTTRTGTYGQNFTLSGVPPGKLIRPSDQTFPRAGGGKVRLFGRTYKP